MENLRGAEFCTCADCGDVVRSFYVTDYYLLPVRRVRARHRSKRRQRILCRHCQERTGVLRLSVNGQIADLATPPRQEVPTNCVACGARFLGARDLYGIVVSTLWMSGSAIECFCLAVLCGRCAEETQPEFGRA